MIAPPRPRTRMQMILVIVGKDARASWVQFVLAGFIAILGASVTFLAASSTPYICAMRSLTPFEWHWSQVTNIYSLAALVTTLAVGGAFSQFYGDELRRGTVRALILYPVDFNDLTIAKLLSATLVGSATSAIAFLVPMAPLLAGCIFPAGGVLLAYAAALATTAFVVWTGAFLAHVLASVTHRLALSPSSMAGLLLLLSILLSQQVLNSIGLLALVIGTGGAGLTFDALQAIWNFAGTVAVLSPHHATATVLSGVLGPYGHFPDVFVVLPIGILVLAYGYLVGRRIPLDVFIK